MTTYLVTVTSDETNIKHTYEVEANSIDEAVDKVLDDVAYDIAYINCEDEVFYV